LIKGDWENSTQINTKSQDDWISERNIVLNIPFFNNTNDLVMLNWYCELIPTPAIFHIDGFSNFLVDCLGNAITAHLLSWEKAIGENIVSGDYLTKPFYRTEIAGKDFESWRLRPYARLSTMA
jgi:hypothetical protein